ncbi:MAG TPA: Mov34/MPN/PAD-1 family protein [Thermoanaerobaculia bacterium]|jgi:integrative and conjugative element protein (TIGR02256 family)|nr:Mov34/MPN/PAD-1 family protein [Thermoanaerobaculia bacterium]
MLTIHLPPDALSTIQNACERAGSRETGGMLFGEHTGPETFRIVEATVHAVGRFASFVRVVTDGFARLDAFFRRTRHDYTRFNYLGEWHSHPSFAVHPSSTDDGSMIGIVSDPRTRALFVVLMIVKIEAGKLLAGAWAYFPNGERHTCHVVLDA